MGGDDQKVVTPSMIEHCIKIHGIEYRFVGALIYDGGSHYRSLVIINGKYLEYDGIRIKKLKWLVERKNFDEGWYAGKLWYRTFGQLCSLARRGSLL